MKRTSLVAVLFFVTQGAFASGQVPECMSSGKVLPVNNEQVIQWKETTKNEFHNRGHIQGTVSQIFKDETNHNHIEATIGNDAGDTVEVIYSEEFGALPSSLHVGSEIEACGDYITANSGRGASPDGALLHWVHWSDTPKHDSGFVVIDGVVCGDSDPQK